MELVGNEAVFDIVDGFRAAGDDADFLFRPQGGRSVGGFRISGIELVDDILQLGGDAPPVDGRTEDDEVGIGDLVDDFDRVVGLDAIAAVALAGVAVAAGAEREIIDVQGFDRVMLFQTVFDRAQGVSGVSVLAGAAVQEQDIHGGSPICLGCSEKGDVTKDEFSGDPCSAGSGRRMPP